MRDKVEEVVVGTFVYLPGRSENVHAFQTLCAIHLREHLIYDPIRNTGAVVSAAKV